MIQAVVAFVVSVMMLAAGCNPVTVVQPNEVGVIFNRFTGELGDPLMPGTHLIDPLADEVTLYSTATQQLTLACCKSDPNDPYDAVRVLYADGEEGTIDVTVLYLIDPASINMIHARWQDRYARDFVTPATRSVAREVATGYSAEQSIYSRIEFQNEIRDRLSDELASEGFILTDFLIRDMTFSQRFSDMMEQRLLATMTAEAVTVTPSP